MSTFNELIDFTRSTTGTYLDSVVYGDESLTGSWTTVTGFDNITSGTGTNVTTVSTSLGASRCYLQINNVEQGKQYKLTVTLSQSDVSSLSVYLRDGASPNSGTLVAGQSGMQQGNTYTIMGVAESNLMGVLFIGNAASFTANVSVKEVTGGQVSGTPLLRTAAINEPRLEYDASGNPLGLLIEEARTNVLTRSNELLNFPWNGDAGNVVSNIPSVDGGQCFKLSSNDGAADYWIQSNVASNGQTKSIWARTVSGTGTAHILGHNSVPATLVTLTEQWQRFSLPVDDSETGWPNFYAVDFRGSGTLSEILVFGAQLESGAFPTSYIPTSGSTVARTADVASLPVERFAFNDTKGSVVVSAEMVTGSSSQGIASFKGNAAVENIGLYKVVSGNMVYEVRSSSTNQASYNVPPASNNFKVGYVFKKNDFNLAVNGIAYTTDTSGVVPTGLSTLLIGSIYYVGTNLMSGHIKQIQYYPKRLSNTELQLLTQPSASPTMNLTFNGQATSTLVEGFHD